MTKVKKEIKSVAQVVFDNGVQMQFASTHEFEELARLLSQRDKAVIVDTVDEKPTVGDECTVIFTNRILTASCVKPNDSVIAVARGDSDVERAAARAAATDGIIRAR